MTVATRSLKRPLRAAAAVTLGIVTAIVAVTNHQDSVQDIIVPGAFMDTLTKMRPKLCWMHDWKDPLGSVLSIAEVKPGDKRLPKMLPDGRPWPAEAGAVIATVQFNLATQRGRDMFAHCKEWAKTGEAAFSIGYKVRDGMASKRADGVRLIYALDLYEVSLVLHGAHNMALALEVKDARPGLETKGAGGIALLEGKAAEPMIGSGAMVALYLDPQVAAGLAQPDGNPADELHVTLAFLGNGDEIADPKTLAGQLAPAVAGTGTLSGTVGGIGTFPEGENGTPVWIPVDVPGLIELRQAVVGALAAAGHPQRSEHGYTPHVTLGYDLPSLEPVESTPVQFTDAYLVIGQDRYPLPLAAGQAPLEGKAHAAVTEALAFANRLEGKSALNAVMEAKSMFGGSAGAVTVPTLGVPQKVSGATKRAKRKTPQEGQETKMIPRMRGSLEERREALQTALDALFRKPVQDTGPDKTPCDCWVNVEATFDDYVIASVTERNTTQSYQIDYTAEGDAITLGQPVKVELDVVAVAENAEPSAVDEGEAVQLRFLDPATTFLADATRRIEAMPEGKSVGVLEGPLLRLMDALAVKGFDVAGAIMGPDEDDEDLEPVEDEIPADDELEPEPVEDLEDGDLDEDEDVVDPSAETVTLDPETVRAQMDELRA